MLTLSRNVSGWGMGGMGKVGYLLSRYFETEDYKFILSPAQKIYCAVRSVNGNGFCQCLFAGLICCPHILETNAHALTLHCVGGEIYARQRNSIQSSLLLLAHKKLDMGNFESKQGDFCLRRGVLRWSKSIFI